MPWIIVKSTRCSAIAIGLLTRKQQKSQDHTTNTDFAREQRAPVTSGLWADLLRPTSFVFLLQPAKAWGFFLPSASQSRPYYAKQLVAFCVLHFSPLPDPSLLFRIWFRSIFSLLVYFKFGWLLFLTESFCVCFRPDIRTGWLGVKHQVTYLIVSVAYSYFWSCS